MGLKRQELTPRVTLDLKKRSSIGIVFYIVILGLVLLTDGYYLRYPSFSMALFALVAGICLVRFIHRVVDPFIPARLERVSLYVFIGSIALTGLIWGVGFARFMDQRGDLNIQLLMVVCTIGLCSGGVVAYIPSLWLSIAYNLLILGPGILFMLVNPVNQSLTIAFVLFSAYMIFIAKRGNTEYWTALENEALLEEKTTALERISQKDGLTGLYNRRYFDTAFELEWKRGLRNQTPIALVLCDIDSFKQVNDTFGHLTGDEYLKMTARILTQVFQRESDMVARYGGEEFVVILPEASLDNTALLAEKLRGKMADAILEVASHSIRATISLGVAVATPQKSGERDVLILRADSALYAAKKNGRNQVCVYADKTLSPVPEVAIL